MEQYKKVVDEGLQTDLNITADCLAEIQKNKMELKEEYKSLLKYSHKYKCNLRRIIALSIIIVMLCVGSAFFGGYLNYNSLKNDLKDNDIISNEKIEYIESFGCRLYDDFSFEIGNIKYLLINIYCAYLDNDIYYFVDINLLKSCNFTFKIDSVEYKEGITMFLKTDDFTRGKNKVNITVNVDGIEYVYDLTI